jgi:hypothetical protein
MNQLPLPLAPNPADLTGNPNDDRKLGLEYALRKHPFATPGAEAKGIIDAGHDANTALSKIDPIHTLVAALCKKIIERDHHGVWNVTTPGQYFIRPSLLVQSVINLCSANIVLCLAEGERTPGRKVIVVGIAAYGQPTTSLRTHFSRAMVVRQIYTTSGAVATASMTIGGTWVAGQVYSVTITSPNPTNPTAETPVTYTLSYTTVTGDANNAGAAASFATAWNAVPGLAALATASVSSGSTVLLTAVNAGSLIEQSQLAPSATGTGTFVVNNAFTGAVNPEATVAFE